MALRRTGGSGEPFQEFSRTNSDLRLSRHDSSVGAFKGFPDPSSDPEGSLSRRRVLLSRAAAPSLEVPCGCRVVNVDSNSWFSPPHVVLATLPQCGGSSVVGGRADLLGRLLPPGFSVVVRRQPSRRGRLTRSASAASSSLYRRVGLRLGGFAGRRPSVKLVVLGGFDILHQSPRTPGDLVATRGFLHLLRDQPVSLFTDNTTALAYLHKEGGTRSSTLSAVAQAVLRLCEANAVHLLPQFVLGRLNVLADSLSRGSQVLGSKWTLCQEVCQELFRHWLATIDLFATSLNHCP